MHSFWELSSLYEYKHCSIRGLKLNKFISYSYSADIVDSEMTKSYLYTMARNAAFQHYNKTKKQAAVTIPYDENIIMVDESVVVRAYSRVLYI